MPSTYTPSLKLEIIANGEQATTWGETTNNNMGTLIEQAITGVQPITLTGDTVLTNFNGLSDESRNAVLVFNGALANTANVVVPSEPKVYILSNQSGANVIVKTASSNGVTLSNGVNTYVYCDGTNFFTAVNTSNIDGDLTVSGNQTVGGGIVIGGNITLQTKITSNIGTLTLTSSTNIIDMATNTGAFIPPYGTTAERPATPALGMSRWNSTGGYMEIWNGVQWQNITGNYAVEYLIVAGGAGGGGCSSFGFRGAGGGGAGGALANSTTVAVGTAYTITVGAGGAAATNGSNSSAFSLIAVKGGFGGGQASSGIGSSGGSGGGGQQGSAAGIGTSGQGFAGGSGASSANSGGGGGGAGAVGAASTTNGGNGGIGISSLLTGSSVYYAGGGGGGTYNGTGGGTRGSPGTGGAGGGGTGGYPSDENTAFDGAVAATSGTTNTGGGGGGDTALVYNGGATQTSLGAGSGGSGIVVLRYASASQRGTGGTVTSYSEAGVTYFVHTFTSSGTFTA
jgi:hypothetical protein